jgi:hypothetical protein
MPIPEHLADLAVFSRVEALDAGLPECALRRQAIERIGRGMFAVTGPERSAIAVARAVARLHDGAWVSHVTAALIHGLLLPDKLDTTTPHVSRPAPASRPRGAGVRGHRAHLHDGELIEIDGVKVSTPARAWLELASLLSLDDLISVGAQLVRIPRQAFEGRSEPHATTAALLELVERHPRMPGVKRARAALALIRVGSDSPMETKVRLALVRAGLPEPELQIALDPTDKYTQRADLGYRDGRIAIQYDGAVHLTTEQQTRDNRRDTAFNMAGWRYIKVNKQDAAEGFRSLIRLVRELLSASAA